MLRTHPLSQVVLTVSNSDFSTFEAKLLADLELFASFIYSVLY